MFTHDTTSYRNQDTSAWGFYFNKYFRDIVGMDRYGITLLYPYMGSSYSINNVLNLGRDGLYSTGTSQTRITSYNVCYTKLLRMGTEANPLVVLEVVPYEGDSEFRNNFV